MSIEEQIFEVASEISKLQNQMDNLQELDYQVLHQYTDTLFELKRHFKF